MGQRSLFLFSQVPRPRGRGAGDRGGTKIETRITDRGGESTQRKKERGVGRWVGLGVETPPKVDENSTWMEELTSLKSELETLGMSSNF